MAKKLERLTAESEDTREGFDEATDTGREIADTKKRQASLMEGLTPPEDSDREAIRAAMEAVRNDALTDYRERTTDVVDDLSHQSEGLQQEGSESESETRDSARAMERAGGISEFGRDAIDNARAGLSKSSEEFRAVIERLRVDAEKAKREAEEIRSEI